MYVGTLGPGVQPHDLGFWRPKSRETRIGHTFMGGQLTIVLSGCDARVFFKSGSWIYDVMWLLSIFFLIRWLYLNQRISNNNHPIGKLPRVVASHDSFQSPIKESEYAESSPPDAFVGSSVGGPGLISITTINITSATTTTTTTTIIKIIIISSSSYIIIAIIVIVITIIIIIITIITIACLRLPAIPSTLFFHPPQR